MSCQAIASFQDSGDDASRFDGTDLADYSDHGAMDCGRLGERIREGVVGFVRRRGNDVTPE
jgi:hypothetical protein